MSEEARGWGDYHAARVWPNELPRSEKQRAYTVNRRIYRGFTRLWPSLFLTWEELADRVGLPDAARRWRWCAWPRSPLYTEADHVRELREDDPLREGARATKQRRWSR